MCCTRFRSKLNEQQSESWIWRCLVFATLRGMTMTTHRVFENVWDALEGSPAEAAHLRPRSDLMIAVLEVVAAWGVTQAEAAKRLSITQPCLKDLVRGRTDKFSLAALVDLAARSGLTLRIELTRPAAQKTG
jgi:predicted XRE-type DNA-binding protein